jgi:ubiquitin-protein ligase
MNLFDENNIMDEQIKDNLNCEKITNKFMLKRLLRESIHFSNNFKSLSVKNENKKYLLYLEDKINYKYNNYCFILNDNYPFKPPNLLINGISYKEFLINNSSKYRNIIKKVSGLQCLCCDNILCSDRWSPSITLIKIINEVNLFRTYKKCIINKIMADKIKNKYLIEDIDLDSWLF